jgi:hypothetical protein
VTTTCLGFASENCIDSSAGTFCGEVLYEGAGDEELKDVEVDGEEEEEADETAK